jgi:hydrogenase-4 membrane subunit HyfE
MIVEKILARGVVGTITNPLTGYEGVENGGITTFFSNILQLIFVAAGMYSLVNLIIAGFSYMTAGGDAKKLTSAWDRIWQTLLGLAIIAGSFVIAAVVGYILFNNPAFLFSPTIYGPGTP